MDNKTQQFLHVVPHASNVKTCLHEYALGFEKQKVNFKLTNSSIFLTAENKMIRVIPVESGDRMRGLRFDAVIIDDYCDSEATYYLSLGNPVVDLDYDGKII